MLIYLVNTGPEISFAVGVLSRFMHNPPVPHLQAIKHVLCYVKGVLDISIFYKCNHSTTILGFTNSNWANCKVDKKSITRWVFKSVGKSISWASKKKQHRRHLIHKCRSKSPSCRHSRSHLAQNPSIKDSQNRSGTHIPIMRQSKHAEISLQLSMSWKIETYRDVATLHPREHAHKNSGSILYLNTGPDRGHIHQSAWEEQIHKFEKWDGDKKIWIHNMHPSRTQ